MGKFVGLSMMTGNNQTVIRKGGIEGNASFIFGIAFLGKIGPSACDSGLSLGSPSRRRGREREWKWFKKLAAAGEGNREGS